MSPRIADLSQARVVITGAGSGLGAAMATTFSEAGARVELVDIKLERAEEHAAKVSGEAYAHQVDVSDAAAVQDLADRLHAQGPVDVVINNAGIAAGGACLDTPLAVWSQVLDVNFRGVLHGVLAFGPAMRDRRKGHIVNIASAAGLTGLPMLSAYSVSKCAVVALSESLRHELAPAKVGVSVVCPGFVRTRLMTDAAAPLSTGAATLERANQLSDLPWRDAEDVADAVISAVRRGRFMVPVFAEAHLLRAGRRVSPGLLGLIKDMLVRRAQGR